MLDVVNRLVMISENITPEVAQAERNMLVARYVVSVAGNWSQEEVEAAILDASYRFGLERAEIDAALAEYFAKLKQEEKTEQK